MDLNDAQEGRRYRVSWEQCIAHQCGPEGSFTAVLLRKTYVPLWPPPETFLESVTWDNGVTTGGGIAYEVEEVAAPEVTSGGAS